jgi:phosphoribosylamine-glycine ligase
MSVIRLTESELVEMIQQIISEKKKKSKKKKKKKDTTLCARGISAAKAKYEVYPSAYANGYAVQVCKGDMPGLDGKKRCSGKYCSGKK